MKAQTFFLAASAFSGALAVPLRERAVDVYTVTSDVVDVVSVTSTVWVSPNQYTTVAAESVQTQTEAAAYTPSTTHHRHADFHSKASSPAVVSTPSSTPVAVTPSTTPTVEAAPSTSTTPVLPSTTVVPTSSTPVPTTSSTPAFTPSTSTTPTTSFTPLAVSTTEAPSTTQAPATPTSVYSAPATTTAASSGGSGSGGTMSGDATYFITGLGSCGVTNTDEDMIVAISHSLMDAAGGSNGNPLCGKKIKATADDSGKSGIFTVEDRCVGCADGDLDFTEAGFESLGHALGDGRFGITWEYVS